MFQEGRFPIDAFIRQHTDEMYCEAVLYPNGDAAYALPSHEQKMLDIAGLTVEEAQAMMPEDAEPIVWLMAYTGCCMIAYEHYAYPKSVTDAQKDSIKKLIEHKIILDNPIYSWSNQ